MEKAGDSVSDAERIAAAGAAPGHALLRFVLVGGSGALAYVVLSTLALRLGTGLPEWLLGGLVYAALILPVYLAHRRFSFRSGASHAVALPRYVTVQAGAVTMTGLLSWVFHGLLALPDWIAATLVIVITSGASFVALRLWAFADR